MIRPPTLPSRVTQKWSRAGRLIKHRFIPHALILMYHRVTALENDPHLLAVKPENFECHLEIIRRHSAPLSLQELVIILKSGRVPNRAVVITFDDGYADNLHQAKPLLERYNLPATIFVTAGKIGSQREFWWDELDRLLLQPGISPLELRLSLNGDTLEWDLGEAAEYTHREYQRDKAWHIECEYRPTVRHQIFLELFKRLYNLPDNEKQRTLADLREWTRLGPTGRSTHRTLDEKEIISLTESGLVEIGAHSMAHPVLGHLLIEEQQAQIRQSKETLERMLEMPVVSFAYPHGSYNNDTVSILNESGFTCACASHPEPVWENHNVFRLPRIGVRDWDRETFEHWFKWWMDG